MIDPKEHKKKILRIIEDEGASGVLHTGALGGAFEPRVVFEETDQDEVVTILFKEPHAKQTPPPTQQEEDTQRNTPDSNEFSC